MNCFTVESSIYAYLNQERVTIELHSKKCEFVVIIKEGEINRFKSWGLLHFITWRINQEEIEIHRDKEY